LVAPAAITANPPGAGAQFAAPQPTPPPERAVTEPPPRPDRPPPPAATGGPPGLQRHATRATVASGDGGEIRLTDLAPTVHRWLLLERIDAQGRVTATSHLENPTPSLQRVTLGADGLAVERRGRRAPCALSADDGRSLWQPTDRPFAPVCGGLLSQRGGRAGWRSTRETVVAGLRDSGEFGESLVTLVKQTVARDEYLERGDARATAVGAGSALAPLPKPAEVGQPGSIEARRLGVAITGAPDRLAYGQWYPAAAAAGVAVGVARPGAVAAALLNGHRDRVNALDEVERDAAVFLLAFDLARFTMDFRVGTDHPGLGWSRHARGDGLGPDGFNRAAPLIRVGMVPPSDLGRLAATFAGGFKREHGAIAGGHYGFVEQGVVLSRPQPGQVGLIGWVDGAVELRVWTVADEAREDQLLFLRQNGVPLIEDGQPHRLVRDWGRGNWSGSAKGQLRSLRAGLCVHVHEGRRWLIYAVFTAATPSAMARVFQAQGCATAMHLDMNAPELTYAAIHRPGPAGGVRAEPLWQAMANVDPNPSAGHFKFATVNDNRDFFALYRR
jgi:hypothetical protein